MDLALLILRVVVGLYLAAHGAQKLFGWFGGPGLKGTEGFLGGMLRFRAVGLWAPALAFAEFGGGLLTAVGLLWPFGPIAIAASQITATFVVHWAKGPWNTEGGYELTLTNLAIAVALAIAGAGGFSIDRLLGLSIPVWLSVVVGLVALLGVLVSIGTRRVDGPQTRPQTA